MFSYSLHASCFSLGQFCMLFPFRLGQSCLPPRFTLGHSGKLLMVGGGWRVGIGYKFWLHVYPLLFGVLTPCASPYLEFWVGFFIYIKPEEWCWAYIDVGNVVINMLGYIGQVIPAYWHGSMLSLSEVLIVGLFSFLQFIWHVATCMLNIDNYGRKIDRKPY